MYNKSLDNHPFTIQVLPECYKTQEMCDKAVDDCFFFLLDSVHD